MDRPMMNARDASAQIAAVARPLEGGRADDDALLEAIGSAEIVMLGEATHGTHEFYRERARISKRLIEERGFTIVAAEADWPDAYRVNRYVRGAGDDRDGAEALHGFERFPTWMWRNADVLDFVGWLRERNEGVGHRRDRAGFYGLDLYSLHASMDAVIAFLERIDPAAAARARSRYGCFDYFGPDTESYAFALHSGRFASCEDDVVEQLVDLRRRAAESVRRDGHVAEDEAFCAERNAVVARDAERYYRTMLDAGVSSWNLRDRHMVETLGALLDHERRQSGRAKAVVWAHNSHVGDARATDMSRAGEVNIGQLVRERFGMDRTFSIGFATYTGTVTAASDWHAPAERKFVRPGRVQSWEAVLHGVGQPAFALDLRREGPRTPALGQSRLERAIGVIYRPQTERSSHYFHADLRLQFDALIHIDHTRAVEPLERSPEWEAGEVPETFPTGV